MRALWSEKKKRNDEDSYAAEVGPLMREAWLSYDISICIAENTEIELNIPIAKVLLVGVLHGLPKE